jgi:AsmA protein
MGQAGKRAHKRRKRRKSRRRGRLALLFPFILVLLAGGLFVAGRMLLSSDFIIAQVTEAVKRETGRKLTIAKADVRLWPRLTVRLSDVSLSDPPDMNGGRGTFMRVRAVDLAVELRPLLQRRLEVKRIFLNGPRIDLRVDARGRANWDFSRPAGGQATDATGNAAPPARDAGTDAADNARGGFLAQVRLAPIRIRNGYVSYADARNGSRFEAQEVNLAVSLPTPDSPLSVKGDLIWRERPVKLSLFIRAPRRLPEQGSGIEARITVPEIKAAYQGLLRLKHGLELAGTLEAQGPSLRRLLAWVGSPLAPGRGLGPFSVKGAISGKGARIVLKKARLSLDGMNAQGQIEARLDGERPFVSAALGVDRIDTNVYLSPPSAVSGKNDKATSPAGKGKASRQDRGDWSDAPIDFSALKALDARLSLATNAILYRQVKIGASQIVATLKNGRLDARLERMAFYGGRAAGRLILDGSRKTPALSGSLTANGIDGQALLRDFAGIERIRGRLSLRLSLATLGRSQREMIARLKGEARIVFRDGAIRGINIARLVRSVKTAIVNGWQKAPKEKTDFAELSATFRITDGVATTTDLKLLGPLVRVTAAGEVDLLRRRLELRAEPKLVASLKGQGGKIDKAGLPVPVIIKGPWDNPRIYPDIEGILRDPEAAYRRLRSLARGIGGTKPEKALEKIEKKARSAVRAQKEKLKEKAVKELAPVVGEEKAGEITEKAEKKARKLLRKLFQ